MFVFNSERCHMAAKLAYRLCLITYYRLPSIFMIDIAAYDMQMCTIVFVERLLSLHRFMGFLFSVVSV